MSRYVLTTNCLKNLRFVYHKNYSICFPFLLPHLVSLVGSYFSMATPSTPEPPDYSDISEQEISGKASPERPEFSDISEQEMSDVPEPQLTTTVPKEIKGKSPAVKGEAKPSAVKRSERLAKRQRLSYDESEYEEEAVDEDDAFEDDGIVEEDVLVAPTSLKGKAKRYVSHSHKWSMSLIYV